MLKNDCVRVRFDDSRKLIVLELILLRRLYDDSFAMKAILKHAATTMNALETTGSTRARELIVMRAKNSLLSCTVFREAAQSLEAAWPDFCSLRRRHFIFLAHFNVT